jgi:mRNA interferase RelE/StbE
VAYSVEFTRAAAKGFRVLPTKEKERVSRVIDNLADDPWSTRARALSGHPELLRIRVGNYRVVYRVEEEDSVVLIVIVGHRKDVYRKL